MNSTADKVPKNKKGSSSPNGEPRFIELLLAERREEVMPGRARRVYLNDVAGTRKPAALAGQGRVAKIPPTRKSGCPISREQSDVMIRIHVLNVLL